MTDAIAVHDARLRFGQTVALDGVSISIPRGTCFGIVRESGSGKTTLTRAVLGLQRLDAGEIRILDTRRCSRGVPRSSSAPSLSNRSARIQPPRCRHAAASAH
ncbi:ATP-binding cassette domain-containing protein [Mesorhizobium sp. B3-1-7]|uniref:ATP-binding cassette domain-containing protein n=1 Tax=Mesorhizobium sp. B3-1-7 TaxID=2589894 RepID=UPI001128178B|nr:ATP-binding cassette domain-containing protein [Mesorhizobium sp. B3-1-7]TPI64643.1 ATP-binding cassette domain-containing protein [Mesorhizobium sp. B3-1-7]